MQPLHCEMVALICYNRKLSIFWWQTKQNHALIFKQQIQLPFDTVFSFPFSFRTFS